MNDRDTQVLEAATRITEAALEEGNLSTNGVSGQHVADFFEVIFKKVDELTPRSD